MSTDQLLTVGLAACCILGIGVCTSTLDASVRTQPQDVITVEASWMPLPSDDIGELRRRAASPNPGDEHREPSPPDPSDAGGPSEDPRPGGGDPRDVPGRNDEERQSNEETGLADTPTSPSLLQRLLALLEALLPWLALLVVVALAYRFRDRLYERFGAFFPAAPESPDERPDDRPPVPPDAVSQTWYDMVDRLDVQGWTTKTPEECALAAIEAGYDSEPVLTVTRLFQEVRYGDEPVTDARVSRARQALDRLGPAPTSAGSGGT